MVRRTRMSLGSSVLTVHEIGHASTGANESGKETSNYNSVGAGWLRRLLLGDDGSTKLSPTQSKESQEYYIVPTTGPRDGVDRMRACTSGKSGAE